MLRKKVEVQIELCRCLRVALQLDLTLLFALAEEEYLAELGKETLESVQEGENSKCDSSTEFQASTP